MPILSASKVSCAFGANIIFSDVNVAVENDAHIGLVGPNGAGKTSLLVMLAGLEQPASPGSVSLQTGIRIGYLRQEALQAFTDVTTPLYDEMNAVFDPVRVLEQRMRDLEHQMTEPDCDFDTVMADYGETMEDFEQRGGYEYETLIAQTLGGLGFTESDYSTPIAKLSGGQKTRALLAKMLLERPHLLILDEPTNHLDVGAIEWLEGTISRWKGAVIIVSHDRYFLDHAVSTIWYLHRGGIDAYKGNYSAYLMQRAEREALALKQYEQEMERMWNEFDYIKKNIDRDATNPQAVGRLRRLSRDVWAIRELGFVGYMNSGKWSETGLGGIRPLTVAEMDKELRSIKPPVRKAPQMRVRMKDPPRSGEYVVRGRGLGVGFPERFLFETGEFELGRGQVAALIGDNGTGKTTFLKTILGEQDALYGKCNLGLNVEVGYFSQAHEGLNMEQTVVEALIDAKGMTVPEARHLLAQYLFRGDDVFKKVGDLSGGERGKLALAILSVKGANFFVLDEPTNHLDIPAQETLESVLDAFEGTILIVSHDRFLVDRLAQVIWHIEDGAMVTFNGSYQDYLSRREAIKREAKARRAAEVSQRSTRDNSVRNQERKSAKEMAQIEAQIHSIEGAMKELTGLIERAKSPNDVAQLGRQYADHQAQLEGLVAQWSEFTQQA
ncbi:MAG: ATP-binding cassette domain-containing protein [Pleurocapsa minor GSE-CHR-MK-17-07R]|jgi:ATP-binding cassette subfamily F protein 3|nr:ATP-binding cassette domain-containing protein [Pleurocapsa minor GSE-CHR-MK 17-07R]